MFEKIVLLGSERGQAFTVGELAEALPFYQRVHLILDMTSLKGLIQSMGIERLLDVLKRPNVSAIYCRELLVTMTNQIGVLNHYSYCGIEIVGNESKLQKPITNLESLQDTIRSSNTYSGRQSRKLAESFLGLVPVKFLMGKQFLPDGRVLAEAATDDVYDNDFLTDAISCVLEHTAGLPVFLPN